MIKNIYKLVLVTFAFMAGNGYAMGDGGPWNFFEKQPLPLNFRLPQSPDVGLANQMSSPLPSPGLGTSRFWSTQNSSLAPNLLQAGYNQPGAYNPHPNAAQHSQLPFGSGRDLHMGPGVMPPLVAPHHLSPVPERQAPPRRLSAAMGQAIMAAAESAYQKACAEHTAEDRSEDEDEGEESVDDALETTNIKRARSFACDICGDQFTQVGDLESHRDAHLANIPRDRAAQAIQAAQAHAIKAMQAHAMQAMQARAIQEQVAQMQARAIQEQAAQMQGGHLAHSGVPPVQARVEQGQAESGQAGDGFEPANEGKRGQKRRHHEVGSDPENYQSLQKKQIRSEEKSFDCKLCPQKFSEREQLTRHKLTHRGEKPSDDIRYQCQQCGKRCTSASVLTNHMRVHTGERPFGCPTCGKRFMQRGPLNRHQRIHSGDKPYKCQQCEKRFTGSSVLKSHMRIHTGDRPFECPQCDKSFKQRAHLNGHLKTHEDTHAVEKPYKCEKCPKSFPKEAALTVHMRVHTGERPYECSECEERFSQKGNLATHMRKKHSTVE